MEIPHLSPATEAVLLAYHQYPNTTGTNAATLAQQCGYGIEYVIPAHDELCAGPRPLVLAFKVPDQPQPGVDTWFYDDLTDYGREVAQALRRSDWKRAVEAIGEHNDDYGPAPMDIENLWQTTGIPTRERTRYTINLMVDSNQLAIDGGKGYVLHGQTLTGWRVQRTLGQ